MIPKYNPEELQAMAQHVLQDNMITPHVVAGDPSRADRLIQAVSERTGLPPDLVLHNILALANGQRFT